MERLRLTWVVTTMWSGAALLPGPWVSSAGHCDLLMGDVVPCCRGGLVDRIES